MANPPPPERLVEIARLVEQWHRDGEVYSTALLREMRALLAGASGGAGEAQPSCLLCGHARAFKVWHIPSGAGVCVNCYDVWREGGTIADDTRKRMLDVSRDWCIAAAQAEVGDCTTGQSSPEPPAERAAWEVEALTAASGALSAAWSDLHEWVRAAKHWRLSGASVPPPHAIDGTEKVREQIRAAYLLVLDALRRVSASPPAPGEGEKGTPT